MDPYTGPEQEEVSQNPSIDGLYELQAPPLAGRYWQWTVAGRGRIILY